METDYAEVETIDVDDLKRALVDKYIHIIGEQYPESTSVEKIIEDIINYYETIIGYMPGNVYWFDKNCIAVGCNKNVLAMHGFKNLNEFKGLTFQDLGRISNWSKEAEQSFLKDSLEVLRTGKPRLNIEEPPIPHADGRILYFLSSRVPIFDKNGGVVGYVGISIDITDIKMAELREKVALANAAEANARAKAELELRQAVMILTGSIVHDLRTPITTISIIGSNIETFLPPILELYEKAKAANLIDTPVINKHLNYLKTVGTSLQVMAAEMHEFINSTLATLSKTLTGGLTEQDLVECSIDYCINQTIARYPFEKDHSKLVKWARGSDFKFMGNSVLMIRILTNLIKNSLYQIQLQQKGEIFIATEEKEDFNILRIKDTAGGAAPDIISNIFEAYKTTKKGGTGVGLAFCKKTMQDFRGDILCNTVYGEYIEFVLTFPKIRKD